MIVYFLSTKAYNLHPFNAMLSGGVAPMDQSLIDRVCEGFEPAGFTGTRLNYQERRIYHWHEELDHRIGVERIPEQLRVAARLSGMIEPLSSEIRE